MKIDLEKGRSHVTVDIPDQNILSVIQGNEVPSLSLDRAAAVIQKASGTRPRRASPGEMWPSSYRMTPGCGPGEFFVPPFSRPCPDLEVAG